MDTNGSTGLPSGQTSTFSLLAESTLAELGIRDRNPSGLGAPLPQLAASSGSSVPITYFGPGNDIIDLGNSGGAVDAGNGNNVVLGGLGNDLIYAGSGNDIIEGGDGKNNISGGEGVNLITSGAGDDLINSGAGSDFIDGGNGRNKIFAGDGDNRILTGKGNDLIFAGAGNDIIYSGSGKDTISAGDGNNIINTGSGNDVVTVGSGNDKIILEAGTGAVTVFGFSVVSDKLCLGESLLGKTLTFLSSGADTLVRVGNDLLATLKGVASGSQSLVSNSPLFRYQATDLGSLSANPNGAVVAASINNFGQVIGRFDTGETFTNQNATTGAIQTVNVRQAFVWENGVQTALTSTGPKNGQSDFGAPDGTIVTLLTPTVNTIGDRGLILGTADEVRQPIPLPTDRALIWENNGSGYTLTINDFGGIESYVFDTNNRNQIPGRNIDAPDHETPIYLENGVLTPLAELGGDGGTARGINGKGQIVGYVDSDGVLDGTAVNTAILWQKNANGVYQLKNLGTFGAEQATLRDINNAGNIIGVTSSGSGATATGTPFLLRNGKFTALGSLGGQTGSTNGLNEFNQVVGASQTAAGTNHAYVWSNGVLADLNNLVSTRLTYNGAAVTLTSAVSINNFGDIVATGTYTYIDPVTNASATGTRSFLLKAML
jgi:probable HAF family extracellular repeat protein